MTAPAQPTVSVVIPAYQAAGTIVVAVDSALNQTLAPHEIIIVDDASTDDVATLVEARYGSRVRVLRSPRNLGAGGARNLGVRVATGHWVAFLDADDVWHPRKLEVQLAAAAKYPDTGLISCGARLHEPGKRPVQSAEHFAPVEGLRAWVPLLEFNFIPTPTVVARRSLLLETGGFDEALVVGEDLDLWIRLARMGRVVCVRDTLVDCHGHSGGLMRRTRRGERQYVLPLVRRRLVEWEQELTWGERRRILGRRLFETAYRELYEGVADVPAADLVAAAWMGHRPLAALVWALRCMTRSTRRAPGSPHVAS